MYTLGHDFVPASIHAGGLRYHGMSPIISALVNAGYIEPRAYGQNQCFEAAIMFARNEGIIPAPETSHAIRAAIDEALAAKETGEKKVILFNLSGHGHFDMAAYDAYLAGQLTDNGFSAEAMAKSLAPCRKCVTDDGRSTTDDRPTLTVCRPFLTFGVVFADNSSRKSFSAPRGAEFFEEGGIRWLKQLRWVRTPQPWRNAARH